MKTYQAEIGHDICCFGTHTFEATDDEQAVAWAQSELDRWDGETSRTAVASIAARIAAGVAWAGTATGGTDDPVSVRKDTDRPRAGAVPADSSWRNAGRSAAVDRWPR